MLMRCNMPLTRIWLAAFYNRIAGCQHVGAKNVEHHCNSSWVARGLSDLGRTYCDGGK